MITRKAILLTGSVILLGAAGGASALLTHSSSPVGADTTPIEQQLQSQSDELANHETRITNTENGLTSVNNKVSTGTISTTTNSTTTPPTNTTTQNTTPAAVVVTGYREIVLDANNSDCEYTYSDGTTYTFRWKTTDPQGTWVTDGNGQNGHWQSTTSKSGVCDNHAIGQIKTS